MKIANFFTILIVFFKTSLLANDGYLLRYFEKYKPYTESPWVQTVEVFPDESKFLLRKNIYYYDILEHVPCCHCYTDEDLNLTRPIPSGITVLILDNHYHAIKINAVEYGN